jgi:hypothetical protein
VKAYVMTSGAIFGLITLAHVWRVFEEGTRLANARPLGRNRPGFHAQGEECLPI